MSEVVEIQAAPEAINAGQTLGLSAETSTLISAAGSERRAIWIFNPSNENVYLRMAATGAGESTAIPIPGETGVVLHNYKGALCAWSSEANEIHFAEF